MFLARSQCCSPASNSLQICRFLAVPWRQFFDKLKEDKLKVKEKPPLDDDNTRYADDEYHFVSMGDSDIPNQATVSFLSRSLKNEQLINIKTISKFGFRTHDNCYLLGPIAIFPKTALSWRVPTPDHITPESLELFFLLQPKLDVLLIGVGDRKDIDAVRKRIVPALQKERIGYEIMPTIDAIATFNFLNGVDNRYVAAALFPPADIVISSEDYKRTISEIGLWRNDLLPDPDRWFHVLDGPCPEMTVCERIWGYTEESVHAMKVIHAMREEKMKMRTERLEEKILKDKWERQEAIAATAEKRRIEAEKEEKEAMERKKLPKTDNEQKKTDNDK